MVAERQLEISPRSEVLSAETETGYQLLPLRGSKEFHNSHDLSRHKTVAKLLGLEDLDDEVSPTYQQRHPALAMKQFLHHVKIDPDGGVLNLENDVAKWGQHSKVKALKKDRLEKGLATFALFRSIANPCAVVFFAVRMLQGYFWQLDWITKLEERTTGMHLPLPAIECFVLTAIVELVYSVCLLLLALKHRLEASCWSGTVKQDLNPSYLALSLFYWHDLPYLQSFSALAPLGLIHPNLITKNLKSFSLAEDAARSKLEAFFKLHSDSIDDLHIVKRVLNVIAQYEYKNDLEKGREMVCRHLESNVYEILSLLQESRVAEDHTYLKSLSLEPDAIFGCRFRLLVMGEMIALLIFGILCLLGGSIAFLTKVSRCFCLFVDTEVHWVVPWAYFLSFINQSLGILPISRLLRWRIECFMFGGVDAYVASEEEFIMRVYMASLAEVVWKNEEFTWFDKMCIMLQLDDDDLQQLVIEDSSKEKSVLSLEVRKYMSENRAKNWLKDKVIAFAANRKAA